MNIVEATETLNCDERQLFLRAHRLFGNQSDRVTADFDTWKKTEVLPNYMRQYLDYRSKSP